MPRHNNNYPEANMLQLQAILAAFGRLSTLEIVGLQSLALLLFIVLVAKIYRRRAEEVKVESTAVASETVVERSQPQPAVATNPPSAAPAAKAVESVAVESAESDVPEDSVLHRHYLANREAERLARTEPYPSDSVLHRHYDAAHCLHLEEPAACQSKPACLAVKPVIPQDSVLRRHFLAQLQAEIESGLPAVPSDSVLRRHYQAMVASELSARLSACQG